MRKVLLATAALMAVGHAFAESDWVKFAETEMSKIYYSPSSVHKDFDGRFRRFKTLIGFKAKPGSFVSSELMDCEKHTYGTVAAQAWSGPMGNGDITGFQTFDSPTYTTLKPDTSGWSLYEGVCQK